MAIFISVKIPDIFVNLLLFFYISEQIHKDTEYIGEPSLYHSQVYV